MPLSVDNKKEEETPLFSFFVKAKITGKVIKYKDSFVKEENFNHNNSEIKKRGDAMLIANFEIKEDFVQIKKEDESYKVYINGEKCKDQSVTDAFASAIKNPSEEQEYLILKDPSHDKYTCIYRTKGTNGGSLWVYGSAATEEEALADCKKNIERLKEKAYVLYQD